MDKIQLLKSLNLGNSIAEQDKNLSDYFIYTNYVEDLIGDKYDIVRGAKGSGKTAMLLAVSKNQSKYKKLHDVILVQAINLQGDPYFKSVFDKISKEVKQQELIDSWKIYIINLVWNKITNKFSEHKQLEKYLKQHKLVIRSNKLLEKVLYAFQGIKVTNKFNSDGSVTQSVKYEKTDSKSKDCLVNKIIDFNYVFSEINRILVKNNYKVWIMMDRLDDAFPDKTNKSILALKSLLYAYKDISTYDNFKIKIFLRNDIYYNITSNGFTSLTHVAAKALNPIQWNKDKLSQLLVKRVLFNKEFNKYLDSYNINYNNLNNEDCRNNILELLFKKQVDVGKNNPDTLGWIINHITDGLGIVTPRDLISIVDKARRYQIEEWKLNDKNIGEKYLVGSSSIRQAYLEISQEKLETQLYAEYPSLRKHIEKFANSKAEHNEESLKKMLGIRWKSRIKNLVDIGFIEEKKNTWKVPFVYREGLNISQGKAF
ncbi:P-loop ATPase, Sll1717 family [Clostridium tyrobutyricum]|uniref:P-loop ATPase, Sll1717 family n=1 Tax=Clostridium tyrobutyricum TaxID=1519 RepID=UPI001C393E53|nr:hypothetical protein [Clostridium tyrobutyricum]MBV4429547.1 hypothetical protein [Clostridium tyrobutyricum]MBV4444768.1 hypothetical protein [Clostridium tyrobutyricum]